MGGYMIFHNNSPSSCLYEVIILENKYNGGDRKMAFFMLKFNYKCFVSIVLVGEGVNFELIGVLGR